MQHKKTRRGFALIEVLVVVLIIGILAAIALPMYNRAVLRSRFNALMPIVKAMNDSNEAYFLEHGSYASNPQDLPVQGLSSYPTGTELEFGSNMDYAYVLATNASAKNNYIMYQKHSTNYPGEIHCEAITGDDLAEYICESAGGTTNLGTTLTEGYTTYVLSGSGAGIAPETSAGLDEAENGTNRYDCTKAEELGFTCTADEENGTKKVCTIVGSYHICRTKTYNEDGSYTSVTCKANAENVCTSTWRFATYDANGNKLKERSCDRVDSSGNCTAYGNGGNDYTYDANGNMLIKRGCTSVASDGSCSQYSTSWSNNLYYTYDGNGNVTSERRCSSVAADGSCSQYSTAQPYDYTYDENGRMASKLYCQTVAADGSCSEYSTSSFYAYDDNGNMVSDIVCSSVAADGSCSQYTSGSHYYTYDENGNQTRDRWCRSFNPSRGCLSYTVYDYTYDDHGNQTSERECNTVAADGSCSAYSNSNASDHIYHYDSNGEYTRMSIDCGAVAADGSCSSYKQPSQYLIYIEHTYDAQGNEIRKIQCTSVAADGSCSQYNNNTSYSFYYTYDEDGSLMSYSNCSGGFNTATGECTTPYPNVYTF